MSKKDPIDKLTDAVVTLDGTVKAGFAEVYATQREVDRRLGRIETDLGTVSAQQLSCPARAGWLDMKADVAALEDDTKQITIRNAERDGKSSRTPQSIGPEHLPKKEPGGLMRLAREKLGAAMMLAVAGGLMFLAQRCTSNDEQLAAQISGARAQIENVAREVKVNSATADALIEVIERDTTEDD